MLKTKRRRLFFDIETSPNIGLFWEAGYKKNIDVYRAKKNNQVIAVIIETIAPDGYSGEIKTLVGIDQEDKILGVRVITHKETPGLGDYIEIDKSQWIKNFDFKSLDKLSEKLNSQVSEWILTW